MAGLFFCLASAKGAGLLFFSATIQPNTSVYGAFCAVNAIYTANAAKRLTGLYSGFSRDLPHSTTAYTRPTQAAIIPPATHWSAPQRRNPPAHTRYHTPRRTPYRPAQTAYYNKVYKGAAVRPYYGSMPDGAAHHRLCQPGGAVQQ